MYRLRAKRTTGSSAPTGMLFGELAYSDANKRFYVGRPDGSLATFESDLSLSPITDSIAGLNVASAVQASQIADLTTDVATLDTSQTDQDTAINALGLTDSEQAARIAAIEADQDSQDAAITALIADNLAQAQAIASFETTAQLDTRDIANRDRANHTGAQAISTVTGLQAALDAKLEAGAIASFETTAQLNARDIANRARGNHTGSQPASTITGLAPVATSGAYGDLSGRQFGFTYDQQAEPVGPTAGQTWRERSVGGLIVGEWEWLGSVWCSLTKTTMSGAVINGASTTYPTLPFEAPRCLFVQCRLATIQSGNPTTPFNSTNYRELFLSRSAANAAGSVFTFRPMISNDQTAYASPMNYLNPSSAFFFTGTTTVGSPGSMGAPSVSWVYREVRA